MLNQQPKCRGKGCQTTKNLFYCHKTDSPRCLKCSDPCSVCKKQRNKPLTQYFKKFATKGSTQCKKCRTQTSKQWLIFSCGHIYCVRCICKNFCFFIKQIVTIGHINSNAQAIKCECGLSSINIVSLLERFCFCCGQELKDKVIALKFKLIINASCKRRVQIDSESFNLGKTYLQKSIYEQLVAHCKKCNRKIEQVIQREQLSKQYTSLCKNCKIDSQDVEKEVIQVKIKKVQKKQVFINIELKEEAQSNQVKKDEPFKQKIQKLLSLEQKVNIKKCVTCSRAFTKDKVISIQRMNICLECHNNNQKQMKSKNIINKVQYQESNLIAKKQTSHIYKKEENQFELCVYCHMFLEVNIMLIQQGKFICGKCYKKLQNEQKQNQSINNLSQSVNRYLEYPNQEKQVAFASKMSKKQGQRCILCFQKILSSQKSQKSEQLGCIICNKCQLKNGCFYSQRSNSKIQKISVKNLSLFQAQKQKQKKSSVDRQKMSQYRLDNHKMIKKLGVYKEKQINFDLFQKSIRLNFEKQKIKNISIKDREHVPSIIQADVQPHDLMPSIQGDTLISCFVCGYFFSQTFILVQSPTGIHKCTSCSMQIYNYQ